MALDASRERDHPQSRAICVHVVRWIAAFPATLGAAFVMQILVTSLASAVFFRWGNVGNVLSDWQIWMPRAISCPFIAAAFVMVGQWVVPTRKEFIAKCGLGIVCYWAAMLMFANYFFSGRIVP